MDRTQTSAGQHCNRKLRNHGKVEAYPIATNHALLLEHAQYIQPALSAARLRHVFDSLELAPRCNASLPMPPEPAPPPPATPSAALFVDFATGMTLPQAR